MPHGLHTNPVPPSVLNVRLRKDTVCVVSPSVPVWLQLNPSLGHFPYTKPHNDTTEDKFTTDLQYFISTNLFSNVKHQTEHGIWKNKQYERCHSTSFLQNILCIQSFCSFCITCVICKQLISLDFLPFKITM